MERRVADLIRHLKGEHTSEFCREYGKCQTVDWKPTFQATTDAEKGVLDAWGRKWGSKRACEKYWRAETTNFEESQNSLMISLLAKRIFGPDTSRYDCCAYACPLFANERGWNFVLQLDRLVGHRTSDARRRTLHDLEAQARRNMDDKRTHRWRQRRKELFKLRKLQNKKHTRSGGRDQHRSRTRHPERDDVPQGDKPPPRKQAPGDRAAAPTQRCCSICHQPGHNARTCQRRPGAAPAAATSAVAPAAVQKPVATPTGSSGGGGGDDDDDDDDDEDDNDDDDNDDDNDDDGDDDDDGGSDDDDDGGSEDDDNIDDDDDDDDD
jgi:hypothetical protein